MKIHDKEPASSVPISPPSLTKRRRPSAKRKGSQDEDEQTDEASNKMVCICACVCVDTGE